MGDRGGDQGSAGLRGWSWVGDGGEEVGELVITEMSGVVRGVVSAPSNCGMVGLEWVRAARALSLALRGGFWWILHLFVELPTENAWSHLFLLLALTFVVITSIFVVIFVPARQS